ncbi:MAG: Tm-1-like ATP-binding domain-containing protein [Streptosporangiales bacterium]
MNSFVAVLATLDTKAAEAAYVRDELARLGCAVRVVDVSLREPEAGTGADVPATEVARATNQQLASLRSRSRRDEAMRAMATGAARVLAAWHESGELAGVLGLGGNQGTAVTTGAMRELPYGLPKLVVSTVASGDVRGFVGDSDITLMFSVGDLLGGPNPVTAGVLARAAAAMAAMSRVRDERSDDPRRLVAVTAFGNTHAAVTGATAALAAAGVRTVPFHASGASGAAMERLIDAGRFDAVLDLTTHELLAELFPDDIYAPTRPGRLTAAGRRGVPQVVAPGGLDYHCFGAADTIPASMRERPTHHHNPNNTNVRATVEEVTEVARAMAERLNAATGPVAVLIPLRGWSEVGSPGGVLHDPGTDAAFVAELRGALSPDVLVQELDTTINDPAFATAAVQVLLSFLDGPELAAATAAERRDGA